MWRLAALALTAASAAAAPPADAVDVAAAVEADACVAGDAECALSLRQLRSQAVEGAEASAALKTEEVAKAGAAAHGKAGAKSEAAHEEGAKAKAGAAEDAAHEAAMEALERRASSGVGEKLTSLLSTFTGKGGAKLYHQTSPEIAAMIMHGGFKPGSAGWCGGAIYFADSPKATFTKAIGSDSHTGVILQANVNLGKVCKMSRTCDSSMTPEKAHAMGCDTIEFNPGDGNEFVVYDSRRVRSIRPIWTASRATAMAFSSELSKDGNATSPDLLKQIEASVAE